MTQEAKVVGLQLRTVSCGVIELEPSGPARGLDQRDVTELIIITLARSQATADKVLGMLQRIEQTLVPSAGSKGE